MSQQRYLVTARKYRPQTFDALVAQEHVSDTLKNAIRLDRLAHAYLFSGPRGVGKTTAARILAKAINCTAPLDEREDGAEPCRQCASCQSFEEGRSLNIIEIDAASNNKVEDIRDLRETVRIPPQGSRKKVYIIDEVHMLSNAAFNALLKTLEEPPPHVLFIFATTEPHKVLPTILSRCQRFDFRRIPVPDIVTRLRSIAEQEEIYVDEASLMLLARKGDGALRDALSVFDQAVSLCGSELTYGELARALGVVDVDLYFEATQYVADRSAAGMLGLVERVVGSGHDLQEFVSGLAEHLRNLLVARTMDDTRLIEATVPVRERYGDVATAFGEADLLRLLTVVEDASEAIKGSSQPRLKLEMALLKMANLQRAADLRAALQKLDRLEEAVRSGEAVLVKDAAPPAASEAQQPSRSAVVREPQPTPPRPVPDEPAPVAAAEPRPDATETDAAANRADEPAEEAPREEAPREKAPSEEPAGEPAAPVEEAAREDAGPRPVAPAASRRDERHDPEPPPAYPGLFSTPALKKKAPSRSSGPEAPSDALPAAPEAQDDDDPYGGGLALAVSPAVRRVEAAWADYVQTVKTDRIHVGSLLQHTRPADVDGDALVVAVPDDFHLRLLTNQHAFLLKHLRGVVDDVTDLRFVVQEGARVDDTVETAEDFDPYEYMQRKREENPVVRAIFERFGGELVW